MSVLNRKMFRNDAARKALSEMGGIVSFSNGGDTSNMVTVILDQNSTQMKPFQFNPDTGEVVPMGQLSEFLYNSADANQQREIQARIIEQYSRDQGLNPSDIVKAQELYEMNPTGQTQEDYVTLLQQQKAQEENPISLPSEELLVTSRTGSVFDPKANVFAAEGPEVLGPITAEQMTDPQQILANQQNINVKPSAILQEDAEEKATSDVFESRDNTVESDDALAFGQNDQFKKDRMGAVYRDGFITPSGTKAEDTLYTEKLMSVGVDPGIANAAGRKIGEKIIGGTPTEVKNVKEGFLDQLKVFRNADKQSVKNYKKFQRTADRKKAFEEEKELFAELLGAPKDKKQDFYEMLALIGFSIAAGESPSAVKNIADGMLTGLSIRREDRKLDQEREDSINMLALESTLGRESATQAARLAEEVASTKFSRDVFLRRLDNAAELKKYELEQAQKDPGHYEKASKVKDDLLGITYFKLVPTEKGLKEGKKIKVVEDQGIDDGYYAKINPLIAQRQLLYEAMGLLGTEGNTVGGMAGVAATWRDAARGLPKVLSDLVTDGELSKASQYDAKLRVLAAQLAPMLLGESGRTISDGDRERVAQLLGFANAKVNQNKVLTLGDFANRGLTSDKKLLNDLEQVDIILKGYHDNIDSRYKTLVTQMGGTIASPEAASGLEPIKYTLTEEEMKQYE